MIALQDWLEQAGAFVWGGPTVVLLLATGAYLSFVLRGVQLRCLARALRIGLLTRDEPEAEGDISHFQALMLALGGSMGVGNVLGVAAALTAGGPGALLWLWLTGWLVMATRYAEGLLGVYYREADREGRMAGGPMYYLSRGVGGLFGRTLAAIFAVCAVLGALGFGSAVPGRVAAGALDAAFSVPPIVTGVVLAAVSGVVLAGGVRAIGRTVGALVPVMLVASVAASVVVIILGWRHLDDVLLQVARGAVTPDAAMGGLFGATIREAVRWGMTEGILSSGTGVGTGGIASAAARTRTATTQALVAMIQTFIDTVVVSGLTGVALLVSGAHESLAGVASGVLTNGLRPGATGVVTLPGDATGAILAVGLALFAFTTILAWAHYGERSAEYLLGSRATTPFRVLLVVAVFGGGLALQLGLEPMAIVWSLSGVASGAMVIPNLVGLLFLSGVVVRETARSPSTR